VTVAKGRARPGDLADELLDAAAAHGLVPGR